MYISDNTSIPKKREILAVVLLIILYLLRSTVPLLKFPFILLFASLAIYSFLHYKKALISNIYAFFINFHLSLILYIVLIFSFFNSYKLYLVVFKDCTNAFFLILLLFFMLLYIKTIKEFKIFVSYFMNFIIIFALGISLLLLSKIFKIGSPSLFTIIPISSDYNFSLVPILFGIVAILSLFSTSIPFTKKLILTILLIVFSITICVSGSRRGFYTLMGIISFLIFIQFFKNISRRFSLECLGWNSKWYLLTVITMVIMTVGLIFFVPVHAKRATLNKLGISIISYRNFTSVVLARYWGVFSKKDYTDIQKIIWNENPVDLHLYSYWDFLPESRVFPLTGKNVDIVPQDAIGYLMDKKSLVSRSGDNAYSFTNISNIFNFATLHSRNEYYNVSVYCYVSEDFNGSWARLSVGGNISAPLLNEYDLTKRGEWQKLSLNFKINDSIPPVYLMWAKEMADDFYNLKGYIIFAAPEFKIVIANSVDPASGWGSRKHSIIFPLYGKNVEIVPTDAVGYKMDHTCDASCWSNNSYAYTDVSCLLDGNPLSSQIIQYYASVYCYVSDDFDGSWAYLSTEGEVKGNVVSEYDLNKRGTWQKLEIYFQGNSNLPSVFLYWSKTGVENFSNLKGYVIFAYPEFRIIGFGYSSLLNKYNSPHDYFEITGKTDSPDYRSDFLSVNSDDRINQKYIPIFQRYQRNGLINNTDIFLNRNILNRFLKINDQPDDESQDKDPVRRMAAKIITVDTNYYEIKNDLPLLPIKDSFFGDRLARWHFALLIYSKEYNLRQKLYGGGFNFLNWFGFRFLNDKKQSDYPHNPFISVLLYSGVFGLIIYLLFLGKAVYYCILYYKKYKTLMIFFIVTFFFSFFSAGSPFDPPIMGFFNILPFIINYIHSIDRRST